MRPPSELPPPAPEPPRAAQPLARIRRSPLTPRLAFESLLIVLDVLFGVALDEWREESDEDALARTALANSRH
jgi:hypothetical protein